MSYNSYNYNKNNMTLRYPRNPRTLRTLRIIRILTYLDYITSLGYFMILNAVLINYTHSLKVSFPTFNKNLAVISNFDVKRATDYDKGELVKLFKAVPMLMFKKQNVNPKEFYEFCKVFDSKSNDRVAHPFSHSQVDYVPQVAIRGNCYIKDLYGLKDITLKYSGAFKNTAVWHQDIVGVCEHRPPVVSGIYMLKAPPIGGETMFASMETAYDNIESSLKKELKYYNVVYSNSNTEGGVMNTYYDYTGYNRIDVNPDSVVNMKPPSQSASQGSQGTTIINREPLVIYSDECKNKKALMLSPFRFAKFDKMSPEDSYDLYRELMSKYILHKDNIVKVEWEMNDLLIFNNRKLIHSSSPSAEYENYERLYYSCFLGTDAPILRCNSI
uniref:TauD/TfdA-like domain-containing protein n=1 Tax=viral metagenome TaxID=1070528 RepID=A0A6C0CF54_9ZZZZ